MLGSRGESDWLGSGREADKTSHSRARSHMITRRSLLCSQRLVFVSAHAPEKPVPAGVSRNVTFGVCVCNTKKGCCHEDMRKEHLKNAQRRRVFYNSGDYRSRAGADCSWASDHSFSLGDRVLSFRFIKIIPYTAVEVTEFQFSSCSTRLK